MVMDGGAPHCGGCHQPLQFGTDRQGRTTESCDCGYRGFLKTRPGQVNMPPDAPAGPPLSGVLAGPALPDRVTSPTARWEASPSDFAPRPRAAKPNPSGPGRGEAGAHSLPLPTAPPVNPTLPPPPART